MFNRLSGMITMHLVIDDNQYYSYDYSNKDKFEDFD